MEDAPVSAFVSYSRTDSAFIDRLEAELRAYGFDTWVDRQHLEGGADWARVIEAQIAQREMLVVALSPDAVTSTWVRREITFALNAGKHVIPVIARPVERIPIEIIEKQYIDLSADYVSGLQDLRVALLKAHTLPPPPRPAQPQPLLALPDVSDPLKGLVEIPAPPPAPNPDLNATFMQAQVSLAHGNLDLAEALLQQIVDQEDGFGHGLASEELQKVRKELEPIRIERLHELAYDAHTRGAWGQEIGALRALLGMQTQGAQTLPLSFVEKWPAQESASSSADLKARLSQAEECQKWAWLYENARAFAQSGDQAATTIALTQLWQKAPFYGDPAHIAPVGVEPPADHADSSVLPPETASTPSVPVHDTASGTLTVLTGAEKGRTVEISKVPFTIGSQQGCDLILNGWHVSQRHATILQGVNGLLAIKNESPIFGASVAGVKVEHGAVRRLQDGDEILLGSVSFVFHKASEPEARNIFRIFSN